MCSKQVTKPFASNDTTKGPALPVFTLNTTEDLVQASYASLVNLKTFLPLRSIIPENMIHLFTNMQ